MGFSSPKNPVEADLTVSDDHAGVGSVHPGDRPHGCKMKSFELRYWLPRIIVIAFALSLICPAPEFVRGLDKDGYIVWLARLIWVISVPALFGIVLVMVAAFWKNGSRNRKDSRED